MALITSDCGQIRWETTPLGRVVPACVADSAAMEEFRAEQQAAAAVRKTLEYGAAAPGAEPDSEQHGVEASPPGPGMAAEPAVEPAAASEPAPVPEAEAEQEEQAEEAEGEVELLSCSVCGLGHTAADCPSKEPDVAAAAAAAASSSFKRGLDRTARPDNVEISGTAVSAKSGAFPLIVRGSIPFSAECDGYGSVGYFEVTVIEPGERGIVAVGVVSGRQRAARQPGWDPGTFGYHSDDGFLYEQQPNERSVTQKEATFGAGDTVGCAS